MIQSGIEYFPGGNANLDVRVIKDGLKKEAEDVYPRQSLMMGFKLAAQHLYGLPERKDRSLLKTTKGHEPYRLFAIDKFPHAAFDPQGLYSGIPYIMGHGQGHDESVMWISASETWVDIYELKKTKGGGKVANFISESGVLEIFLFASTKGPKQQFQSLATITGAQRLPPFYALGFHYCKWEETSANHIIDLDFQFELNGFALDVLWMDIGYSKENMYFTFNPLTFPQRRLRKMNEQIENHKRRLVVITDPHIKATEANFVAANGKALEASTEHKAAVFVKQPKSNDTPFEGWCWPG